MNVIAAVLQFIPDVLPTLFAYKAGKDSAKLDAYEAKKDTRAEYRKVEAKPDVKRKDLYEDDWG